MQRRVDSCGHLQSKTDTPQPFSIIIQHVDVNYFFYYCFLNYPFTCICGPIHSLILYHYNIILSACGLTTPPSTCYAHYHTPPLDWNQDLLVHVRDQSHPQAYAQRANVLKVLAQLDLRPGLIENMVEVVNKVDKL